MRKIRRLFPFALLLLLVVLGTSACKKDSPEDDNQGPGTSSSPGSSGGSGGKVTIYNCQEGELIINEAEIEGYADKKSYYPGDLLVLYIHSLSEYKVEIFRMGKLEELLLTKSNNPAKQQNYYCYSYSHGCNWDASAVVEIPSNWRTGMYSAKITNQSGTFDYVTFILKRPQSEPRADIFLLANTNTWEAYNNWGGASFYKNEVSDDVPTSSNISFKRPCLYDNPPNPYGHLTGAEMFLIRWLEENGYDYDLYADRDLHEDDQLLYPYDVMILQVHPEYWTKPMYNHLYRYMQNGGNLMYLGGNGVYWKVVIDRRNDILEVRRKGQHHKFESTSGGRWRDLGLPESRLLGVEYDARGIHTAAPYTVLDASHWIFQGTSLKNGDLLGTECVNNDGASGHETDKITTHSPPVDFLARGNNPDGGGANLIYYKHEGGGAVFSAGSISYTSALPLDSNINRITRNVLNKMLP